ncbi:MAG: hypothetical protein KTR31_31250 [Myxococcales bacterium]|nr:hypothetical protein [Myxococcales bacterium]
MRQVAAENPLIAWLLALPTLAADLQIPADLDPPGWGRAWTTVTDALQDPGLDAATIAWHRDDGQWTLTLEHEGRRASLNGIPPADTHEGRVEQLFVALGLAGHLRTAPSLRQRLHPPAEPAPSPPEPDRPELTLPVPPVDPDPAPVVVHIYAEEVPMPTPTAPPTTAHRTWRIGALTHLDSDQAMGLSVLGLMWPGLGVQLTATHNGDARDVSNVIPSSHRLRVRAVDIAGVGEVAPHPRLRLGLSAAASARFVALRPGTPLGVPLGPAQAVGVGWVPTTSLHVATELGRSPMARLQLAWVHDLRRIEFDVGGRTTRLPTDRLRASFGVLLGPSR